MNYPGLWLWEAQSVSFYEGLGFWGGSGFNNVSVPGGSAREGPHVRGGFELGSYEEFMNVSRIFALGGWICRVYEGLRLWGGSGSRQAVVMDATGRMLSTPSTLDQRWVGGS